MIEISLDEQDAAYERAVLEARSDPAMREVIKSSFLQEDPVEALEAFEASEHFARVIRGLGRESVPEGGRILELGGGRGLLSIALGRRGYNVSICEPNPSLVCGAGAAAALVTQLGVGVNVVNGFVAELRDGEPFDAVVCRAVLHHVQPLVPVLADALATLKPGGLFLASDEPTIRREDQLPQVLEEHPFVRYGVEEWAGPVKHYLDALREAGFERTRSSFPVALADYRTVVRPDLPAPVAMVAYGRYRMRSAISPHPGEPRLLTARRPA